MLLDMEKSAPAPAALELRDYIKYYHTNRSHLSLNKDAAKHHIGQLPDGRDIVKYAS